MIIIDSKVGIIQVVIIKTQIILINGTCFLTQSKFNKENRNTSISDQRINNSGTTMGHDNNIGIIIVVR